MSKLVDRPIQIICKATLANQTFIVVALSIGVNTA